MYIIYIYIYILYNHTHTHTQTVSRLVCLCWQSCILLWSTVPSCGLAARRYTSPDMQENWLTGAIYVIHAGGLTEMHARLPYMQVGWQTCMLGCPTCRWINRHACSSALHAGGLTDMHARLPLHAGGSTDMHARLPYMLAGWQTCMLVCHTCSWINRHACLSTGFRSFELNNMEGCLRLICFLVHLV